MILRFDTASPYWTESFVNKDGKTVSAQLVNHTVLGTLLPVHKEDLIRYVNKYERAWISA